MCERISAWMIVHVCGCVRHMPSKMNDFIHKYWNERKILRKPNVLIEEQNENGLTVKRWENRRMVQDVCEPEEEEIEWISMQS